MNKQELVEAIHSKLGPDTTKREVEETLNVFLETVAASLRRRESIQLTGFGTFEARSRSARKGLNPRTGESVRIRATTVPVFRPGTSLKDTVAKKTAAKKAATKKSAAKKAGAKKAATKKAGTKKAGAKKGAAKKAGAKKAATKKAGARKTATKRAPARKTTAKSTRKAAKKTAKKTARKR